jgi:hypothetical protein
MIEENPAGFKAGAASYHSAAAPKNEPAKAALTPAKTAAGLRYVDVTR